MKTDLTCIQNAAEIMQTVAGEISDEESSLKMREVAERLLTAPDSFNPELHSIELRQGCLAWLKHDRGILAFLVGDPSLAPFAQDFLDHAEVNLEESNLDECRKLVDLPFALPHEIGSRIRDTIRDFTKVIDEVDWAPIRSEETK